MGSFLAGLIAVAGLGVIAAGVLNNFALLELHLSAWQVSGGLVAMYLLGCLLKAKTAKGAQGPVLAWVARGHGALLILLGLALFAAIPALWWGIIKKLASGAVKGG